MSQVRINYKVYLGVLALCVPLRWFHGWPYLVAGLSLLVVIGLGYIARTIEIGTRANPDDKCVRRHLRNQMSILMLLVIAGIVATLQAVLKLDGYARGLHTTVLIANALLYTGTIGWIAFDFRRSFKA